MDIKNEDRSKFSLEHKGWGRRTAERSNEALHV